MYKSELDIIKYSKNKFPFGINATNFPNTDEISNNITKEPTTTYTVRAAWEKHVFKGQETEATTTTTAAKTLTGAGHVIKLAQVHNSQITRHW